MILLDTNVLTEPWRPSPDPAVLDWLDRQPVSLLHLSAITVAEVRLGIALLPVGRRRDTLARRLDEDILPFFDGRILPFDLPVSDFYARIMAGARQAGVAVSTADGAIAATAARHGLTVATRDTRPFLAAGLTVVNPWIHPDNPSPA